MADLLYHFPVRYSDRYSEKISELIPGEIATILEKFKFKLKRFPLKIPMAEGTIEDISGKIKLFGSTKRIWKMLHEDDSVKLTGKVTQSKSPARNASSIAGAGGGIYLANPEFEKVPDMPIDAHDTLFRPPRPLGTPPSQGERIPPRLKKEGAGGGLSYPIYAETRGITSKWFYHAIEKFLREKTLDGVADYLPSDILKKYNLPALKTSFIWTNRKIKTMLNLRGKDLPLRKFLHPTRTTT